HVRERHRHPRLTATTFGRDATGCAVDSQNCVLDHDLVCPLDHHVRPAHLATLLSDTLNVTISQSLKRHVAIVPISIDFVKNYSGSPSPPLYSGPRPSRAFGRSAARSRG